MLVHDATGIWVVLGAIRIGLYELFGTVFALISIWLSVKQSAWAWPTGLVNNFLWVVLLFQQKLYAGATLQVIYIVIGFYGWFEWLWGGENRTPLPVSRLRRPLALGLAALCGLTIVASGWSLDLFTDTEVPYWDAIPNVISLFAQGLLARKVLENWGLWVVANVVYLTLYAHQGLYLMAAIQLVFAAMSVQGHVEWRRDLPPDSAAIPLAAAATEEPTPPAPGGPGGGAPPTNAVRDSGPRPH